MHTVIPRKSASCRIGARAHLNRRAEIRARPTDRHRDRAASRRPAAMVAGPSEAGSRSGDAGACVAPRGDGRRARSESPPARRRSKSAPGSTSATRSSSRSTTRSDSRSTHRRPPGARPTCARSSRSPIRRGRRRRGTTRSTVVVPRLAAPPWPCSSSALVMPTRARRRCRPASSPRRTRSMPSSAGGSVRVVDGPDLLVPDRDAVLVDAVLGAPQPRGVRADERDGARIRDPEVLRVDESAGRPGGVGEERLGLGGRPVGVLREHHAGARTKAQRVAHGAAGLAEPDALVVAAHRGAGATRRARRRRGSRATGRRC